MKIHQILLLTNAFLSSFVDGLIRKSCSIFSKPIYGHAKGTEGKSIFSILALVVIFSLVYNLSDTGIEGPGWFGS